MTIKVKINKLRSNAVMPQMMTSGAAASDIYACLKDDVFITVLPGATAAVPTGIALEIPEGFAGFVYPRSGLASRNGIVLSNCVGVIDSDYRGELIVSVFNRSASDFVIENGMRIAQLVISPVINAEYIISDSLSETERGTGGFGSTGAL